MFITGNKKEGFQIHFNEMDMKELVTAGDIARITLSADKAKELEDRLEAILKEN